MSSSTSTAADDLATLLAQLEKMLWDEKQSKRKIQNQYIVQNQKLEKELEDYRQQGKLKEKLQPPPKDSTTTIVAEAAAKGLEQTRTEQLETTAETEVIIAKTIEQQRLKKSGALTKQFETEKKQITKKLEIQKNQLQKKIEMEKKQLVREFETEKKQLLKANAKEIGALQKAHTKELDKCKKEMEKLTKKYDAGAILIEGFRQKVKALEKELKQKEKALQKTSKEADSYSSRKRRRLSRLMANTNNTEDDAPAGDGVGVEANADTTTDHRVTPTAARWQHRYEELQHFFRENGHSNVPARYVPNPQLGKWVTTQRTAYRFYKMGEHSSLNLEKIHKLQQVNFVFCLSAPGKNWYERYQELVAYREKHDHCNVPQKHPGGLGAFVLESRRMYREGTLAEDKITKLEQIGFVWSLRNRGGTLQDRMRLQQQAQNNAANNTDSSSSSPN